MKKREKKQPRKMVNHLFKSVLLGVIFIVLFSFNFLENRNPYSWLYNSQGTLHADSTIKADSKIIKCLVNKSGYSEYLQNRITLLNNINYPSMALNSGYSDSIILEIYLQKIEFPYCVIKKVNLLNLDTNSIVEKEIENYFEKCLLNEQLYHSCDLKRFRLHIPIILTLDYKNSDDNKTEINKGFDNNWFFIRVKNNVIDYH